MNEINDGGPAFPLSDSQSIHRVGAAAIDGVTDSAERDRIYIEATARACAGMTLRDYFAAKELSKVDCVEVCDVQGAYDRLADHCYRMADAMLRARGEA
ncbi:hypothetical protein WK80_22395 [Burkholderia multivorans]|uniref:hypothetical protein n=1 Tax=Burkholderia multivorans TaxID=87883 RepID=UPI00075A8354|nr:hypothetical protein [Burkholderia multivorans]KVV22340.1 hypothetical protein WK80_22395 [Burkholderia multivorans]